MPATAPPFFVRALSRRSRVAGVERARSLRVCDTDGDATLAFRFPDLYVRPSEWVEVWFSDPVTRYDHAHPASKVP